MKTEIEITIDFKKQLTKAFKEVRKLGYFARQNYTCCNSCGWNSVPYSREDKVIFYHRQDNDNIKINNNVYLSWRGNAQEIIQVFSKYLKTEWDGTEYKKIKVMY